MIKSNELEIAEIQSRIEYVINCDELSEAEKITIYRRCLEILESDRKGGDDYE